jgi:hypothetical protein
MNPADAQATETALLLIPAECADTDAATTATPIDVSAYEGSIVVTQAVGVVTAGTITGKLVTGDNAALTDAADISGAVFTAAGTATDNVAERLVIQANECKKYLGYVGTIDTGPAVVGVTLIATPKYA